MKRMNYLYLMWMALCATFTFVACDDDDDKAPITIDPVMSAAEWVAGEYTGTTYTDLDSRGMTMRIDTTYNQPLVIAKDSLNRLVLTYPNWTDHTGMSYGDFRILPLEATRLNEEVLIKGHCTDTLYKAGVGYPATLRAEGTISGTEKVARLTLKIDMPVSPAMTLKFTLEYEGGKRLEV